MKPFLIALSLLTLILSCNPTTPKSPSLNGTWESIGSGWTLEIRDSTSYSLYDVTPIATVLNKEAPLSELMDAITLMGDTLLLKKGVMTYTFVRAKDTIGYDQEDISKERQQDPLYNFDVFAETVKEHYAFMDLNQLNWKKIVTEQRQKLAKNPTDLYLYQVIEETLAILHDNHGFIEADASVARQLDSIAAIEEIEQETVNELGDFQVADKVAANHLVTDMTKDSWLLKWGDMGNDIGYIQVKAMWLYAKLDIPKTRIDSLGFVDAYVETFHQMDAGRYIDLEVTAVRSIMDRVMADLKSTKTIVVDLRFNGGGQDAVNFEILKRFNDTERQVVSTKLKHREGYTNPAPLYLEASENPYKKPVYVLTSKQTGSAAEAFAIGSIALPNIKRIGTPTQGALSTALEKKLPNGWYFAISNEVYMDVNGNSYENIGVPVSYPVPYAWDRQTFFHEVADNLEADKMAILMAIAALEKK